MPVKHNTMQVVASLKKRQAGVKEATRAASRFMGTVMRDAIREQIPPDSRNNQWDAYAATGKLQSYVVSGEPEKTPTGWKVKVYVPRYNLKYFRVHEEGAVIHPKTATMLVFPLPPADARYTHAPDRKTFVFQDRATGRTMIATEYVIIRPKHYFKNGVAMGIPLIRATIGKELTVIFKGYGVTS